MSDIPIFSIEPLVTIHTWSLECLGPELTASGLYMTGAASGAWQVGNAALFLPFTLTKQITAVEMFTMNGSTASENVDIGIYSADGTRLISIGPTAQSGTSNLQIYDITDTTFGPGLFYMAVVNSGTTGTFYMVTTANVSMMAAYGMATQAGVGTLPATATMATLVGTSFTKVPLIGLTVRVTI